MSSTYSCAVSVLLMTTKGIRLPKKMALQTLVPCWGSVWRTIVKAGSPLCPVRLQTCLRWSSGHSRKRDSLLKTICPQSASFQPDRTMHHCDLARQCAGMSGKWRNGRRERGFRSLNRLWMVMMDSGFWLNVWWLIEMIASWCVNFFVIECIYLYNIVTKMREHPLYIYYKMRIMGFK